MRAKRLCGLLLLFALLAACRSQSPTEKVRAELKATASWAATARMVGETWSGGSVPSAYASRSLRTAAEALEESRAILNAVAQDDSSTRDLRSALLSEIQKLKQVCEGMRASVAARDSAALSGQLKQLSSIEGEIAELKKAAGIQS
jgi:uncharacterized protein (UPF0147 family)